MYRSLNLSLFTVALVALLQGEIANCQLYDGVGFRPLGHKNCKSNLDIISVEADGCPGPKAKCNFKLGTEPRIRIGFIPRKREIKQLETTVRAKLGTALVTFNLDEKDACKAGNLTCPLKVGQTYYYSQSVKILPQYPKVNVQVNWILDDKSEEDHNEVSKREVCIIFLATLVE
ncbi:hypothetical protein AB6A40_005731 [Gnathostoma spinigerum]|uniref:MD-2-related lipid-recognition domain-containing protein n=1 Tax=Gnathostoma spinigerum TaxID=75299 RepID=A0ABD6EQQ6_9BILA